MRVAPPLNALRAFEAAARHLSLTKAAQELNVTPGAISHQIRGLETLLGVELFERRARSIALTPAGSCSILACRPASSTFARPWPTSRVQGRSGSLSSAHPRVSPQSGWRRG